MQVQFYKETGVLMASSKEDTHMLPVSYATVTSIALKMHQINSVNRIAKTINYFLFLE